MAPCTPTKRARILQLRDPRFGKPKTLTEIGHIMHLNRRTVAQNLKIVQETGDFYYCTPWPGRPHLLTFDMLNLLLQEGQLGMQPMSSASSSLMSVLGLYVAGFVRLASTDGYISQSHILAPCTSSSRRSGRRRWQIGARWIGT